MKKKLDAANIVNELRGQSAFFPSRPSEELPEQPVLKPELPEEIPTPPPPIHTSEKASMLAR